MKTESPPLLSERAALRASMVLCTFASRTVAAAAGVGQGLPAGIGAEDFCSRASPRVAVIEIQGEVAQREEGRCLLEEVLLDHVQQGLVVGELREVLVDGEGEPRDLRHRQGVLDHPGQDGLDNIRGVALEVEEERVVDAVQDVHVVHDPAHLADDPGHVLPVVREVLRQQGLVVREAFLRGGLHHLRANSDGDRTREELDVDPQLPEHRVHDSRALDGPDAGVEEEAGRARMS